MIAVTLFCVACAVYWLWSWYTTNPDEPPLVRGAWPVLGHVQSVPGDSCISELWNNLNYLATKSYEMGGVVRVKIGPRTAYVITDPDDMFTVANTCLEKDGFYDFTKPCLGDDLVTAKLSIWKNHRKLLNLVYSQSVLDSYMGVFNSQSRKLVKALELPAGKGVFEHWYYTRHNALETICLTTLGVDFTDSNLSSKYVEAMEMIFHIIIERFAKFWWHSPYTFQFSNLKKKQDECLKILNNMSDTVLQRRKSDFTGNTCAERSIIPGTKFKAFIDLLLENNVLSDKEIREHVNTMIVGGHDTSANVLMYTMLLLGENPEVQEKVFEELIEVLGDEDRDIEKQDLSHLVYMEAVIKESMRIHTIVPLIARKLDKNVKLKNCTLTSGRSCFLFVFGLHQHPIWGPDRDQFIPERWLNPARLPKNPKAYAPFSFGSRMCVGKTYAYMSLKTTLAHLVRRFRFTADDSPLRLEANVMLKPHSGYYISIERRT